MGRDGSSCVIRGCVRRVSTSCLVLECLGVYGDPTGVVLFRFVDVRFRECFVLQGAKLPKTYSLNLLIKLTVWSFFSIIFRLFGGGIAPTGSS